MPAGRRKLPGVLLLLLSALGILYPALLVGWILVWLIRSVDLSVFPAEHSGVVSLASLALLIALLNIPTLLLCMRHLANRQTAKPQPDHRRTASYLLIAWLIVILAGALANQQENARGLLIPLSLPAVFLPIYWLTENARRGLPRLSALREWGTLTIGLTAAPFVILTLEIILLGLAALAVLLALGFNPALREHLASLPHALVNMQNGMQSRENVLFALSREPLIGMVIFLVIGVAAPLVEELLKPLAVWLLVRRPLKPFEGYTLGLISGGAFALMESASLVSQFALSSWLSAVALRSVTSVLHIGLSGWVGFGIARAWQHKHFSPALLSLLGATALHGIWNSMALLSGLSASSLQSAPEGLQAGLSIVLPVALMVAVLVAVIAINIHINGSLRRQFGQGAADRSTDSEQPSGM